MDSHESDQEHRAAVGSTDLADFLLRDAREELTRADSKASLLTAAVGVVVGALVAAMLAQTWTPANLDASVRWLWWVGAASIGLALIFLGAGVYPRTVRKGRSEGAAKYFADAVRLGRDGLPDALNSTSLDEYLLDQLFAVSHIVDIKYRCIRIALWCLALGASAVSVSVTVT